MEIHLLIKLYLETNKQEYFEEITTKLEPLIQHYTKKLYYLEYEDGYQELELTLYETILHMKHVKNEFACLSYIKKSILHKYYNLYKKSKNIKTKSLNTNKEFYIYFSAQEIDDCLYKIDLFEQLNHKSIKERIIIKKLLSGYWDYEIAQELGYSRQYINKLKKSIIS